MSWNHDSLTVIRHFFKFLYDCRDFKEIGIGKALMEEVISKVEESGLEELADDVCCLQR